MHAGPLDHREGAGVPDTEPGPRRTGAVQLAAGGAVEDGVAHQHRVAGVVARRHDHDPAPVHALADVVVGLADQRQGDAVGEEGAEGLARLAQEDGPGEARRDVLSEVVGDLAAELGPHRAVGVGDRVFEIDLLTESHGADRVLLEALPELRARPLDRDVGDEPARRVGGWTGVVEQPGQIGGVGARVPGLLLPEALHAADGFVHRSQTERGQQPADLLGDEQQVRGHHLRCALVLGAQIGSLGGDPYRTRVAVAGAHHDAALGEQDGCAEGVLVGAEERGDDDVATGLEPAVHADADPVAQALGHEHLLGLGETQFPREPGVLDRGQRRGAGAPVGPRDVDDLRQALAHAGGDGAHPRGGYQLHRDRGPRVDLLEVEDELAQVFDRVDVVVRGRGDQRHPGLGVPEARDLVGDLVAGELSALTGLGALGHLDLELVGPRAVLGGHAEAARSDLLDAAVAVVVGVLRAVTLGVLAALAGVGLAPDHVHRDRQRLVGFLGDGAVADGARGEAAADLGGGLHLVQGDRGSAGHEVEQVPRRGRGPVVHEFREPRVQLVVALLHRHAQGVGGALQVGLAAVGARAHGVV